MRTSGLTVTMGGGTKTIGTIGLVMIGVTKIGVITGGVIAIGALTIGVAMFGVLTFGVVSVATGLATMGVGLNGNDATRVGTVFIVPTKETWRGSSGVKVVPFPMVPVPTSMRL